MRVRIIGIPLLAVTIIAVACNGDGGPAGSTPGATPSPQAGLEQTPSPEVTPGSPGGEPVIRQAVTPDDLAAFLAEIQEMELGLADCEYDQGTGEVDCSAEGFDIYRLDAPLQGGGALCRLMLADGDPVGLSCRALDPIQAAMYALGDPVSE